MPRASSTHVESAASVALTAPSRCFLLFSSIVLQQTSHRRVACHHLCVQIKDSMAANHSVEVLQAIVDDHVRAMWRARLAGGRMMNRAAEITYLIKSYDIR